MRKINKTQNSMCNMSKSINNNLTVIDIRKMFIARVSRLFM